MSTTRRSLTLIFVSVIVGVIFGITGTSIYQQATKGHHGSFVSDDGTALLQSIDGTNDANIPKYNPPVGKLAKKHYNDGYKDQVLKMYSALQVAYAAVKLNEPDAITEHVLSTHPRLNTLDPSTYPWFVLNHNTNLYVDITTPIPQLSSMTERIVAPISNIEYSWSHTDFIVAVSHEHYDQILATVGAKNTDRLTQVTLTQKNAELLLGISYVSSSNLYYVIPID